MAADVSHIVDNGAIILFLQLAPNVCIIDM